MRAIEATRKYPVTVSLETTVLEAARRMDEAAVGCVVVVEGDRPVGILTDRDIAVRVVARQVPPERHVADVMSSDLITLDADGELHRAYNYFSRHMIRRLPLVRDGRLVGLISVDDLIVDVINDAGNLLRPVTGQVIFGHPDSRPQVAAV